MHTNSRNSRLRLVCFAAACVVFSLINTVQAQKARPAGPELIRPKQIQPQIESGRPDPWKPSNGTRPGNSVGPNRNNDGAGTHSAVSPQFTWTSKEGWQNREGVDPPREWYYAPDRLEYQKVKYGEGGTVLLNSPEVDVELKLAPCMKEPRWHESIVPVYFATGKTKPLKSGLNVHIIAVVPNSETAFKRVFIGQEFSASAEREMNEAREGFRRLGGDVFSENEGQDSLKEWIKQHADGPIILIGHSEGKYGSVRIRLPDGNTIDEVDFHKECIDAGVCGVVLTCYGSDFALHERIALSDAYQMVAETVQSLRDTRAYYSAERPTSDSSPLPAVARANANQLVRKLRETRWRIDGRRVVISVTVPSKGGRQGFVIWQSALLRFDFIGFAWGLCALAMTLLSFNVWQTARWKAASLDKLFTFTDMVKHMRRVHARLKVQKRLMMVSCVVLLSFATVLAWYEKRESAGDGIASASTSWILRLSLLSLSIGTLSFLVVRTFPVQTLRGRMCRSLSVGLVRPFFGIIGSLLITAPLTIPLTVFGAVLALFYDDWMPLVILGGFFPIVFGGGVLLGSPLLVVMGMIEGWTDENIEDHLPRLSLMYELFKR